MKNQEKNENRSKKASKFYAKKKDPRKKESKDYLYYTGSNHQASDFETTTEFIINHVKGEFKYGNDIAESLRELKYVDTKLWYPTLKLSTATDPAIILVERKQYELIFKAKLDATVKREEIYENNKTKAYSLIWERCTRAIQSKIEQRTDFDMKIYNDPIKLIKTIKEHVLNYQETKYSMEIIDNALIHFLLLKQKDDPLHEYVKKFKTAKEVAECHIGGPIILSKYMKILKDYDEKDNKKIKELQEKSWEKFCAYKFQKNANNQKYGTVIEHLRERKSIGM